MIIPKNNRQITDRFRAPLTRRIPSLGFGPLNRLVQLIAALLVCLTLGLHWATLQAFAWTAMIVERSQTGSLSEAIRTTFDGRHPCKLCKVVRTGQAAEKKSESQLKLQKLELPLPAHALAVCLPSVLPVKVHTQVALTPVGDLAPPVPPPRLG